MLTGNFLDIVPERPNLPGTKGTIRWLITSREGAPNFTMRVVEIAQPGDIIPLHVHDYEHEVFVIEGQGRLLLRTDSRVMTFGDFGLILAGEEHGFENTGSGPFRFVCVIPNQ